MIGKNHTVQQHPHPTKDFEWQAQPETILGIRSNGETTMIEWLVNLPDSEATWEPSDFMRQQFPTLHLERFIDFLKNKQLTK